MTGRLTAPRHDSRPNVLPWHDGTPPPDETTPGEFGGTGGAASHLHLVDAGDPWTATGHVSGDGNHIPVSRAHLRVLPPPAAPDEPATLYDERDGTFRPRVGDLLLREGVITQEQLDQALEAQARTGDPLGATLVTLGFINRLALAKVLAHQSGLPLYNVLRDPPDTAVVRLMDEETARRLSAIPVAREAGHVVVAFADPFDTDAWGEAQAAIGQPIRPVVTSELDLQWTLERVYRDDYIERSTSYLAYRHPKESAVETFTHTQRITLLLMAWVVTAGMLLRPIFTLIVINTATTAYYLATSLYRLWLMYRGATHDLTLRTPQEGLAALRDDELPVYTILVPLYGEGAVLPSLFRAIAALDYPTSKLDIKLLFEESDTETLAAAKALRPPGHFQFVVVPDSLPRTKPKACNYGLIQARGQYCVVYDAEDIPDPDQLKKAVLAFRDAPADIICLQARLNYYNRDQNLLTRWFTTEYSMWFDLVLPGLDATGAPIPLGGTSNHFVTERLRELGAWDPHNVTEDADLGIRLYKAGYRTAIIDSTTFEEANSAVGNWTRQRSRWVKGYMQTWLVHMRHPVALFRALGPRAFLSFQMVVGGTPATFLINLVYWLLTALWFGTHAPILLKIFPAPVFYLGTACLVIGNFIFLYLCVAGCLARGYHHLVRYALIAPAYWLLMSVAACLALYQLITKPFYWEKTTHGLHLRTALPATVEDSVNDDGGHHVPQAA